MNEQEKWAAAMAEANRRRADVIANSAPAYIEAGIQHLERLANGEPYERPE